MLWIFRSSARVHRPLTHDSRLRERDSTETFILNIHLQISEQLFPAKQPLPRYGDLSWEPTMPFHASRSPEMPLVVLDG